MLNNREEDIDMNQLTVSELLELKKFTFHLIITKINGRLVKKEERDSAIISDGDEVIVLHMISGG
ncbi:MAG: sulfur carrier protein ThiS [Bacteroidetes bacterium]|nr:sulfur carrier protein ThiS [Bacteroidota bacterium]